MLRRRAPIIVVAVIVGIGAGLAFSAVQSEKYKSTASLLFQPLLLDAQVTGLPLQLPTSDAERTATTNVDLVSLGAVRTIAAARLGPGYTAERLKNDVSVTSKDKSDIVDIVATAPSPEKAAEVANAVAAAFVSFRRNGLRAEVLSAVDKVRAQLKQPDTTPTVRKTLRDNLSRLTLLASVQTGDVSLVQPAQPPSKPSSPKKALNAILGGGLGLLLGLGIALVVEQLDRRVRRTDQLEDALGLPLLAVVPRNTALRKRADWGSADGKGDREPFRRLRARLRHTSGNTALRSVLVTSARARSGKTTVATHLAAAAAVGGARVLLIEADLRRPRLAEMLGLPREIGLSRLLTSEGGLAELAASHLCHIPLAQDPAGSEDRVARQSFDVLPAGPATDDPSELLDSDAMRDLLVAARSHYDLVVVDGPPPTLVSDTIPLMKQVDGVLVVGALGRESDEELRALREELARYGVTPVGAVANFSGRIANPYYAKRG